MGNDLVENDNAESYCLISKNFATTHLSKINTKCDTFNKIKFNKLLKAPSGRSLKSSFSVINRPFKSD